MNLTETTTYHRAEICSFRKAAEKWGEFSNMRSGFPLKLNEVRIYTSEHLYQACKLPGCPNAQREILGLVSPMGAKMRAKKHREFWRGDWESINLDLMRWCVHLKFAQHFEALSKIIAATEDRAIVEDSHKDQFWGAVPTKEDSDILIGRNVLGQFWMELRTELNGPKAELLALPPALPAITDLQLFGEPIYIEV